MTQQLDAVPSPSRIDASNHTAPVLNNDPVPGFDFRTYDVTDLSPKERVFQMLASVARTLDESPDLNAERHHLATLVEHCRSWESQVADLPRFGMAGEGAAHG